MYTKKTIIEDLKKIGIKPTDTLLVHSSMNAIGEVKNGADDVLDGFIEYMKPGLLVFPTHTWETIGEERLVCDLRSEPSCVGLLSNLFMKRSGVLRSWHPTHSVAAIGKDAKSFIESNEKYDTPCHRESSWGKLLDRKAKILFLGCSLRCNTFMHAVEEWNNIPNRIAETHQQLKIIIPDGKLIDMPIRRHHHPLIDVSQNYEKMKEVFIFVGAAIRGYIGAAESFLCDAHGMYEVTTALLKINPALFDDDAPVCPKYISQF